MADYSTSHVVLALLVLIILIFAMYANFKGMCRFTEGDGVVMTMLKHLLNTLTFFILGIVMFFVKGEDCGALKQEAFDEALGQCQKQSKGKKNN